MEKHVKDYKTSFLTWRKLFGTLLLKAPENGQRFLLNPFCEADGQWTSLWYKMTRYLMENQKKEPQMKKLCNPRTVGELFACWFKPSKGRCDGEKGKSALFSCTTGKQGGVAEKNVLREFGNGESELDNLIRLRRIKLIHRSSGCMWICGVDCFLPEICIKL